MQKAGRSDNILDVFGVIHCRVTSCRDDYILILHKPNNKQPKDDTMVLNWSLCTEAAQN